MGRRNITNELVFRGQVAVHLLAVRAAQDGLHRLRWRQGDHRHRRLQHRPSNSLPGRYRLRQMGKQAYQPGLGHAANVELRPGQRGFFRAMSRSCSPFSPPVRASQQGARQRNAAIAVSLCAVPEGDLHHPHPCQDTSTPETPLPLLRK